MKVKRVFVMRRRRQASSSLEFALLLPMLVSVALLCVDFGRFVHSYIAITNATRTGAAFASMHPVTPATQTAWANQIRQVVINEMSNNSWFVAANLTMSPAPIMINEGNGFRRVKVEASYPFSTVISWPLFANPHVMHRIVVMRQIR